MAGPPLLVAAGIISRAALSVYISNCRLLTRNEKQHPGSAPVFAEKTGSSADAEICRFYGGLSDYQFGKTTDSPVLMSPDPT
jgi:hypothetical protein